jgi:tRNA dimethylallyltransferase
MPSANKTRVAFIVGPTGVGKTDLSLNIAEELNAEIVSADSRYLYKRLDIGTAKPTLEELARIPHHLVNVAEIDTPWSMSQFKREALLIIKEIQDRHKIPLVVGGTGQYIRALIEGWEIPMQPGDPALRESIAKWAEEVGGSELHQRLSILDPEAADQIDFRNMRRTIRALEVILHTGEKFSAQRNRKPIDFSYKIAGLMLPREILYRRIDDRIAKMILSGFVEEVKTLLAAGFSLSDPPLSAIGYPELVRYLHGEISLEESLSEIKKRTRQFVRRQANWFKPNDERITWFDVSYDQKEEIIQFFLDPSGWRN